MSTTDTTPAQLTWDGAQEAFASALDGYEQRDEQTRLALAIEDALASGGHLLAQAGCGVGKSYGSLIPAIALALSTGAPVVYATATKALQTQVGEKDLPFLQAVLGAAGFPFTYEVIRGRGNYLCRAKLAEAKPEDNPHLLALGEELDGNDEHSGLLETVVTPLEWFEKSNLTSGTDECPGKKECPFGETCFSYAAQTRAKTAHIVVVNHSVLVIDASIKRVNPEFGMLPPYAGVIVDEGHNLENYATDALGSDLSINAFSKLGAEVSRFVRDAVAAQDLDVAAMALFEELGDVLGRDRKGRVTGRNAALTDEIREGRLQAPFGEVYRGVKGLRAAVLAAAFEGPETTSQIAARRRLRIKADKMLDRISSVALAPSTDLVRWIENDDRRGVILKYAPLSVAEFLRDNVWNVPARRNEIGEVVVPPRPRPAVVMSATLAIGNDFSFVTERLGLDDAQGFDAGSPFDIAKQARLYVPGTLSHPSKDADEWRVEAQIEMRELVLASGGGALILFTSTKAMKQAHAALAETFEQHDLQVLMQGDGRTPRELAAEFDADEDSVLFALKSFMEGVDFKGRTCRLVIIDKLPFAVPDDVMTKARADVYDVPLAAKLRMAVTRAVWQRGGSFEKLSRPNMTLVLIQAFGRLIRTKSDRGLVAILDPRLRSDIMPSRWPSYGKIILKGLPPAPVLDTRGQALSWLAELEG